MIRPVVSLPFERRRIHGVVCVVESCRHMRLTGWALVRPWQPAALELRQGSRTLEARVHRVHRPDVLSHLGADPRMELDLGFSIELPAELWEQATADGGPQFHLSVDGMDADMPSVGLSVDLLEEWQQSLLWSRDPALVPAEWQRLSLHLRHHLPPDELRAVGERIEENRTSLLASDREQKAPLRWAVEEVGDLRVCGWAVLPRGGEERFQVVCNGQVLPAPTVRYERSDVQQALGAIKLDSGFEVCLPSSIWRHVPPGKTGYVQILIAGQPVLDQAMALSAPRLAGMVAQWRTSGQPLSDLPSEHRFRALTLIEHVQASGLLQALPKDDLKFLADAAAAEGVHLAAPLTARVDPSHMAVAQELWQLQRQFNAGLRDLPRDAETLYAVLEQTLLQLQGELSAAAVDRFLVSLIPTFCMQDALPSLRLRLPQHELDILANSDGRWELSILIPVTLLDELAAGPGRLASTVNLMQRLCSTGDRGWIETGGLLDAWRRLARDPALTVLDDADLQQFLALSLQFFGQLGNGPDSRLYDTALIEGMHHLLSLAERMGPARSRAASTTAVRHYGLCPQFWSSLATGLPASTGLPQLLSRAQADLGQLTTGLDALRGSNATAAIDACRLALASLRDLGCEDADNFHRHLVLAHAAAAAPQTGQALELLQGLHPDEALRWLGPASLRAEAVWPADDWARLMRDTAPAPPVENSALRDALLGPAEGRLAAAVSLCGESHAFVGLLWLAHQAHLGAEDAGQALGLALSRTLSVCERHRARYPNPPAAVSGVLAWAGRLPAGAEAAGLVDAALLQSLTVRAADLWPWQGEAAPLPVAPVIGVAAPGVGTLVVVKSRAADGSEPLARIAGSWGHDLQQAGIPWVQWQDSQGPVGFTEASSAGTRGRVHAPTLLALLSWLIDHSDFGHVLLLDEDSELDVHTWRSRSGGPAHHYHGAALLTPLASGSQTLDKSPRGTRFASTEQGLALSRFAAERALHLRTTSRGARLARDSFDEEKYLGDLLALADIALSEEGHVVHPRRSPQPHKHAFGYQSFLPPLPGVPTVLTQALPGTPVATRPGAIHATRMAPRRLWPTDRVPGHDNHGRSLSLVELSEPEKAHRLAAAACVVVAAARNERVLLPHFLAHYRRLGVQHFVIIDNLSTDGSREYLLEQPDVVVYSADSPYSLSRYGVAWQQTVLAAHATGRWALVADLDEFLVWPGCETESLPALCERLSAAGAQAARVLLIDMYPEGALQDADFGTTEPFAAASCFDARAAMRWELGSGHYSNSPTWVSGLRHRLLPQSAPNHYTAQKVALMRHMPWVRCSEGLHYAAGLEVGSTLLGFAHFKFHSGFHAKVLEEVRRAEHYNAAEEYRQYQALLNENSGSFFDPMHSRRYTDSQSFAELLT